MTPKENKPKQIGKKHGTGASTTWNGQCTSLWIATLARNKTNKALKINTFNDNSGQVRQPIPVCWPSWPTGMASPQLPSHGQAHTIMQAIVLLIFPCGLHLLLSWTMLFSQGLELQSPSQHWIHHECYHQQISLERHRITHKKRKSWKTSSWQEKGKCLSKLTCCHGPPSGLVVTSKIFSA